MVNANKAVEVFTDVLHNANMLNPGSWLCNPYDVEFNGRLYQFCADGVRAYAIPAVISEEDFDGLPRSVKPTPSPHLSSFTYFFEEYKGEGHKEVKLPSIKAMEEARKKAKYEGFINRPYEMDNGYNFIWYDGFGGQHPRPVLDLGLGEPKLPVEQVIQALQVIRGCKVYVGKANYPTHFTDGEAHAIVMPMSPDGFYKAMREGEYKKESRAWKL